MREYSPLILTCFAKWDVESGVFDTTLEQAHTLNISALAASSTHVFSGSRDYSVKAWDLATKTCTSEFSCPRNIVTALAYSPSAQLLFQGSEDLCVRAWDVRSSHGSAPSLQLGGYVYFPLCLALQAGEQLLATGCKGFNGVGCGVVLWDVRKPSAPLAQLAGHSQDVVSCVFSPARSGLLLTASKDGSVLAWDAAAPARTAQLQLGSRKLLSGLCAMSAAEQSFAAAAMDGSLTLFRCAAPQAEEMQVLFETDEAAAAAAAQMHS